MTTIYAQDIGRWAADIPQTDYFVAPLPFNSRRSSFNNSLSSDSPALSATSHQSVNSSQTSLSALSFTASDLNVDFDPDVISHYNLQQDSEQSWQDIIACSAQDAGANTLSALDQAVTTKAVSYPAALNNPQSATGYAAPQAIRVSQDVASLNSSKKISQNCSQSTASAWDNHRSFLRQERSCAPPHASRAFAPKSHCCVGSSVQPVAASQALRQAAAQVIQQQSLARGASQVSRGVNPRRTSAGRCWSKPSLVRQDGRREDFVMHLVESAAQFVSYIWPTADAPASHTVQGNSQVITLSFFIQETLKRSRSTYSTLQVTLFYLYLIKISGCVPSEGPCEPQQQEGTSARALGCGRRMFLAALILASKYLQDRNYSTKAWSKITSLPVQEINANERAFLSAIGYSLHLPLEKYNHWCGKVQECVDTVRYGGLCAWGGVIADMSSDNAPASFSHTCAAPSSSGFISPLSVGNSGLDTGSLHTYGKSGTPASSTPIAAPPSPMLSRPLTTPFISPWNSGTPAASITNNKSEYGNDFIRSSFSTSHDPLRRAMAQRPAATGSNMAPALAFPAGMATSQSPQDLEAMCTEQLPIATTPAKKQSIHRSRSYNRRMAALSRSSTTSCYISSPLRTGVAQLPTPPTSISSMSSAAIAPLDSPSSSSPSAAEETTTFSSAAVSIDLVNRVAQEAQKHGLGLDSFPAGSADLTLPPIKFPSVHDSFSDASSEACSDMSWTSSPVPVPASDYAGAGAQCNLPALAHVLRCGLREHLKPYVHHLRQTSLSPLALSGCAAVSKGVKRGCVEEVDEERLTKVQRAATF